MLVDRTILSLNILTNYPFGPYLPFFLQFTISLYIDWRSIFVTLTWWFYYIYIHPICQHILLISFIYFDILHVIVEYSAYYSNCIFIMHNSAYYFTLQKDAYILCYSIVINSHTLSYQSTQTSVLFSEFYDYWIKSLYIIR